MELAEQLVKGSISQVHSLIILILFPLQALGVRQQQQQGSTTTTLATTTIPVQQVATSFDIQVDLLRYKICHQVTAQATLP